MKIFGLHDGHACGYYRMLLPLDMMAADGHDVSTSCGWQDKARDYDIIVGQRVGKSEALPLWRRLRMDHKLVYETDDDVWSIDPTNVAAYMTHSEAIMDATAMAVTVAHMVTVSTEQLAEVLRRHHDNVVVLPNFIDEALLKVDRPQRDRLTIGWAGGDSHLKDIAMITPELRRFLKRNPDVEFHNVGTDYTKYLGIPGRATGWNQNMFGYYGSVDFDIGLAPLVRNTFNNSKSHIKALEYAALGIPVIASDEPPYRDFVLDGVTGYLVRDEHEWGHRLWQLTNDDAMRKEMGAQAKVHAADWTIQRNWHLWEDAYREL